jgi:hypothetical protein
MNVIPRTIIKAYRLIVSPLIGARCRFYPSCSAYAHQAFETYPWRHALMLSLKRLARCHPWNEGGVDRVPRRDSIK